MWVLLILKNKNKNKKKKPRMDLISRIGYSWIFRKDLVS